MRRAAAALLSLAPLLLATSALARDVPAASKPLRDDVGLLDDSSAEAVRAVCAQLEREASAELAVLIIDTTGGEDPRAFAIRVFESWRISERGALLLFVTRDRRVELRPGRLYEGLLGRSACERLLTGVVVPRMRSGQPREAVVEGARAVAEKIGEHEHGHVHAPVASTSSPEAAEPSASTQAPPPTRPTSTSAGIGLSPGTRSRLGRDLVRALVFLGLIAWAGYLYYILNQTFKTGFLALSKGGIIALALLVPVGAAALLLWSAPSHQQVQNVDWGLGGAGALAGVVACTMTSHICPRCRKWMSITSRTLVSPTYHSSGTGQRTYDCSSCQYHLVETYTISRKTRSSSSRRGSSSGGRSSFGGGSSRGGGGGASW